MTYEDDRKADAKAWCQALDRMRETYKHRSDEEVLTELKVRKDDYEQCYCDGEKAEYGLIKFYAMERGLIK